MKNKITYIAFAGFLNILVFSCSEDFLQTKPTSSLTEANYFTSVDELESALYACYSAITAYYAKPFMFNHLAFPLFAIGDVGSDDSEAGGGDPTWDLESAFHEISMSRQGTENFMLWFWWRMNYDLIAKCNLVIDKSAEMLQNPDFGADRIERIVDQAKFFRAFGFYNLVTMYGDIPMPTHFLKPDELDLVRTSASLVWDQIEKDLEDATKLPLKSEWGESGRISQGAAYALLGKVYMWQEEYGKAIDAYNEVINSNEYALVTEYGDVHRHGSEHGIESIFEFQHATGTDGGDMTTWFWIFTIPSDVGAGWGWGFGNPTQDLIDEFEPGDPRIIYTAIFEGDVFPSSFSDSGRYVVENNGSQTGYTSRKTWIPVDERTSSDPWNLDKNYRYCRYAEVLLFCAEALNKEGQPEKAKEYLKMVRQRARNSSPEDADRISCVWDLSYTGELLPDVTTSDPAALREAIWHEQRVELAFEGHRRWILLRTERFKEAMEVAKGAKGCIVEDHEWLLPIHPDEVNYSNGRIPQNPGYN